MSNRLPGPFDTAGADGNSHAFISFGIDGHNLHSIPFDHITKADIVMSGVTAEVNLTLSDASFTDVLDVLAVEMAKLKSQNKFKTTKESDVNKLDKKTIGSLFTFQFGWKYPLWKYPPLSGFVLEKVETSITTSAVKYEIKFLPLTTINLTQVKQNNIQLASTFTIWDVVRRLLSSIGISPNDIKYIPDIDSRNSSLAHPIGEIGTVSGTTVFDFLIAHIIPLIHTNAKGTETINFNLFVNPETNKAFIIRDDSLGKYAKLKSTNPKPGKKISHIGTQELVANAKLKSESGDGDILRNGVFSLKYGRGSGAVISSRIINFEAGNVDLIPYFLGVKGKSLDKDTGKEVTSEDTSSPQTAIPSKGKSVKTDLSTPVDFDEKSYIKRVESIMEAYSSRTLSNTIKITTVGNPAFTYTAVMRKHVDVSIILPNGIRHFLSGKYMITEISHHLEMGKYTTDIECQKVETTSV